MGLPATALLMVYASVQCDWQAAWARTVVGPAHDEGDEEQRQEHEDEPCASAGAGAVARGPHAPRQRRERAACARATKHSRRHARAPARTRAGGQAYAARRHVKCGCSMPHDAPCATCVRVQAALAHAARSASTAVVVGAHHGERSAARLRVGPPVFGLPASATCDEATGTPQAALCALCSPQRGRVRDLPAAEARRAPCAVQREPRRRARPPRRRPPLRAATRPGGVLCAHRRIRGPPAAGRPLRAARSAACLRRDDRPPRPRALRVLTRRGRGVRRPPLQQLQARGAQLVAPAAPGARGVPDAGGLCSSGRPHAAPRAGLVQHGAVARAGRLLCRRRAGRDGPLGRRGRVGAAAAAVEPRPPAVA